MEGLVKGDVAVVPFPFSNLAQAKRRPALVLAVLSGDDLILCQITSNAKYDQYAVPLLASDFQRGGLATASFIRPNKLFTADKALIFYKVGTASKKKLQEAVDQAVKTLKGET